MTFLYRIIVTVSALLVIVIGGSWLAEKYNIETNTDWWEMSDWRSFYNPDKTKDGIPATAPGNVSIQAASMFTVQGWEPQRSATLILPVYYGSENFFSFSSASYRMGGANLSGGSCGAMVVNLLVVTEEIPEGAPAFSERVLLPKYFYFEDDKNASIAALVIRKDTNGDDKLDCGDEARIESVSLTDGSHEISERAFILDNITGVQYDDRSDTFSLYEVIYEDSDPAAVKRITIQRDGLTATEQTAPDLLSKAQSAFSVTSDD